MAQALFVKGMARFALLIAALGMLAACASDEVVPQDKPVEELYSKATELLDKKSYREAAKAFEEVERQHPYSQWASRAELMAAYAKYQAMDYDDAIATLDQFIQLHPGNPNTAYAYYLKALCDYERLADVRRDQSFAMRSRETLEALIARYPDSAYARDAALKLALVKDHLAGAEMEVGRNYMDQKIYTAAIGRFRTVIEKYQTTSHVPEALHRLVECSLTLGLTDEAKAAGAVLGHNFPGSEWYQDSYNLLTANHLTPESDKETWISRAWRNVF